MSQPLKRAIALGTIALSLSATAHAIEFDIPPQPLESALLEFSEQANVQVSVAAADISGLKTAGLKADTSPEEALAILLKNTDLVYSVVGKRTYSVIPSNAREQRTSVVSDAAARLQVAQADSASVSQDGVAGEDSRLTIAEIIVTAQKRGEQRLADIPMSIAVLGNMEIERRGLVGMEDYLRAIPGVNQIDQGPLNNAIVIRGITTSPAFENFSSGTTVPMRCCKGWSPTRCVPPRSPWSCCSRISSAWDWAPNWSASAATC